MRKLHMKNKVFVYTTEKVLFENLIEPYGI